VNDLDAVRAALITARDNFIAKNLPANADKQVGRALGRFALVAAAGELAIALGVLPWPEGEATQGSGICFRAWVEQRGGTGSTEIAAGLAKVRKFFELHGESRFTPWDGAIADRPTSNRAGLRRLGDNGVEFYVFPEVFKTEICAGFDSRVLAREMAVRGLLIPGDDGRTSASCSLPGIGKRRVYHFSNLIMGGDNE
jgi:putative DNA primase/helicase